MKKSFLLGVLFSLFLILPVPAADEDDATVLYNKGIDLYEQDKVNESIATFKKAIAIDPEFYEAYYNLARIQESQGLTQDAIKSYEKLLEIEPTDYESTYQFGEFLYKKGYLTKASTYLNKIPSNSEYKTKADSLLTKISKRQKELAEESRVKAQQSLKSSTVGNVPAPSGLVVNSEGSMFVASFSESSIIKISKNGMDKTVFADKAKGLDGPIGLAIDSYDNIYVANYNKGNVLLVDKNGNAAVLMYAKKPYCINLDEKRGKIYITEQETNSVVSYDIQDILKSSATEAKLKASAQTAENKQSTAKVITTTKKESPLGTPSIIESNFTRTSPQTSITSPIMIPSDNMFD